MLTKHMFLDRRNCLSLSMHIAHNMYTEASPYVPRSTPEGAFRFGKQSSREGPYFIRFEDKRSGGPWKFIRRPVRGHSGPSWHFTMCCTNGGRTHRQSAVSAMLVSLAVCTYLSDLFGRSLETHLTFRQRFADGNFLANIMQLIREFPQLACAKSAVVVSIIHVASNVFCQVMCRNMRSESILREPLDQMEFQMKRSVRARWGHYDTGT